MKVVLGPGAKGDPKNPTAKAVVDEPAVEDVPVKDEAPAATLRPAKRVDGE